MYSITDYIFLLLFTLINTLCVNEKANSISLFATKNFSNTLNIGGTSLCDNETFNGAPFVISFLVSNSVMLIYNTCFH